MEATFTNIRRMMRAVLDDTDPQAYSYSDEVLNQHVELNALLMGLETDANGVVGSVERATFSLIFLKSCESIIVGVPDSFSYKGPVISASRSGVATKTLSWITSAIIAINAGRLMAWSGELDAMYSFPHRYIDEITKAIQ